MNYKKLTSTKLWATIVTAAAVYVLAGFDLVDWTKATVLAEGVMMMYLVSQGLVDRSKDGVDTLTSRKLWVPIVHTVSQLAMATAGVISWEIFLNALVISATTYMAARGIQRIK